MSPIHGPGEKLQKVLARAGLGSRRQIETWISEGRIKVDGQVATLGQRVDAEQRIEFDGRVVSAYAFAPNPRVLIYFKPEGEVCTRSDPQGRPTIFEKLPTLRNGRWISIGRLDYNTSGLLLLTTDGELAHRLMHPSREIEREYAVRVLGEVTDEMAKRLLEGVELDDGVARFDTIVDAGGSGVNRWYHVTLKEGRNREVRRLWEAVGATVSRLIRVRYGNVALARHIRPGRSEYLEEEPMAELYASVGLTPPLSYKEKQMEKQAAARAKAPRPRARTRETLSKSSQRSPQSGRPYPAALASAKSAKLGSRKSTHSPDSRFRRNDESKPNQKFSSGPRRPAKKGRRP